MVLSSDGVVIYRALKDGFIMTPVNPCTGVLPLLIRGNPLPVARSMVPCRRECEEENTLFIRSKPTLKKYGRF